MVVLSRTEGAIKICLDNVRVRSISSNSIVLKVEGYDEVIELTRDDIINFDEIKEELREVYIYI